MFKQFIHDLAKIPILVAHEVPFNILKFTVSVPSIR